MTFFEKRNKWQESIQDELIKNPNIMTAWSDDSNMRVLPDGTVEITYPNPNLKPVTFKKAVTSIEDFFKTL